MLAWRASRPSGAPGVVGQRGEDGMGNLVNRLRTGQAGISTCQLVLFLGAGAVALGIAGLLWLLLLSPSLAITVQNRSCGRLNLTAVPLLNVLPAVNFPAEIPQGAEGVVELPGPLVEGVTLRAESVEVDVRFLDPVAYSLGRLDLQQSTWDGTGLVQVLNETQRGSGEHTLVLACVSG